MKKAFTNFQIGRNYKCRKEGYVFGLAPVVAIMQWSWQYYFEKIYIDYKMEGK